MQIKSGYKNHEQRLKQMRDVFYEKASNYARHHPNTFFAAIFVNEVLEEQAYIHGIPNCISFVLAVTAMNCPMI